jgi:hypothetical protein
MNVAEYTRYLDRERETSLRVAEESIARARRELDHIEFQLTNAREGKDRRPYGAMPMDRHIEGVDEAVIYAAFHACDQVAIYHEVQS